MFDKVKAIFEEQLGVSQDEMQLDTTSKMIQEQIHQIYMRQ